MNLIILVLLPDLFSNDEGVVLLLSLDNNCPNGAFGAARISNEVNVIGSAVGDAAPKMNDVGSVDFFCSPNSVVIEGAV